MVMIISTAILAILNGVFYRAGGSGNYPRWTRPVGIGLLTCITLFIWHGFSWDWPVIGAILASGGITAGMSTTYLKKKGANASWINWALVGLVLALACLPYAWITADWYGFGLRVAVLTPAICLWSQIIGWDVAEEFGRGFLTIATIPLIFLW